MATPFIIIGVGNLATRILGDLDKEYELIGAFDDALCKKGKTVSQITGNNRYKDVFIQDCGDLQSFLSNNSVFACIILTSGCIKDIYDYAELCALNAVHVITSCEEAFAPPVDERYQHLLEACRKNRCAFIGTGFREVMWGQLILLINCGVSKLQRITMRSKYSLYGCNQESLDNHGVGYSETDFQDKIVKSDVPPMMWNVHIWLCMQLGLTVVSNRVHKKPIISEDIIIGTDVSIWTETTEGTSIFSNSVGVYTKNQQTAQIEIELEGDIVVSVCVNDLDATAITANVLRHKMYSLAEDVYETRSIN